MDDKDLTIENKLREFRKKNRLSQEDLAEKIGISRQSVISLEQGKTMPSLPLAISLCRFFDAAFEDMFAFEREIQELEAQLDKVLDDTHKSLSINITPSGQLLLPPVRKEKTMVELEPWRPFREAISLRDAMDKLFEDSFITQGKLAGMPKVDIIDKADKVVVKAEIPGVAEEDVNVEILDNVMTISGEKTEEKEEGDEKKGYFYKESHSGAFTRTFTLPADVRGEEAVAEVKDGILMITIPKVEPKKAKKITIQTKK